MSFSQFGEDDIVARLFHGNYEKTGNLIDCGAYEPADLSNSRLLIERGWDATLIEFTPMAVKDLAKAYADNPSVRVVQAALATCPQGMQEFRVTDDGLSSNDPAHFEKWKDWTAEHGSYYGKLWVPTITVEQIMDQFYCDKPLHFVNVDTEGTSVDIALQFMQLLGGWRPKVVCVEYDDRLAELSQKAQELGYRQEWIGEANVILVAR